MKVLTIGRLLHQSKANVQIRSLSSAGINNFAKQRAKYEEEIAKLRSSWGKEFKEQKLQKELEERAEKEKIIVNKAIKLRELRKIREIRTEEAKRRQEADQARYLGKLASTHVLHREKLAVTQRRMDEAIRMHEDEAHYYITAANIDQMLPVDFFDEKPKTTGLTFSHSRFWSYKAESVSLKRMNTDEALRSGIDDSYPYDEARLRGDVGNYLNEMIGSGQDRAKFEEYVQSIIDNYSGNYGGKYVMEEGPNSEDENDETLVETDVGKESS